MALGKSVRTASTSEHTGDATIDRIQSTVRQAARQGNAPPFAVGTYIDTDDSGAAHIAFVAATWRQVTHKLGRLPNGFLVLNNVINTGSGAGSSTRIPVTRNPTTSTIEMISDVTCYLDLWFF